MKPRRDITLGEMQEKCVAYDCANCDPSLANLCRSMQTEEGEMKAPKFWDLTDPPRFTEAQMAFWRGWYAIGARFSQRANTRVYIYDDLLKHIGSFEYGCITQRIDHGMQDGETLDLAELLGKDGESK